MHHGLVKCKTRRWLCLLPNIYTWVGCPWTRSCLFLPHWLLAFCVLATSEALPLLIWWQEHPIVDTDLLHPTPLCLMDWILNLHLGPRTTNLPTLPPFLLLGSAHHTISPCLKCLSWPWPTMEFWSHTLSCQSSLHLWQIRFFSSLAVTWLNRRSSLICAFMAGRSSVLNLKIQSAETHKKETSYIKLLNLKPLKMYL